MKSTTTSRNGASSTTLSRAELVAKRLKAATCAQCLYLVPGADADFIGQCHRNAPPAGLITLATEQGGVSPAVRPIWPLMRRSDACGEFLRRPVK